MTTRISCRIPGAAWAFAVVLLIPASAGAQVKWNLPNAYGADATHTLLLQDFAKDVAKLSNNKLQITVHPGASMYKAMEIKPAVAAGKVQIGEVLMSNLEKEDPMFGVDVVPFLAIGTERSDRLWRAARPYIEQRLEKQGLKLLYNVPWPSQGLFSTDAVTAPTDLKGLSFRAYNDMTMRVAEELGASPVKIQAADLPAALSAGRVKSWMSSSMTGYEVKAWTYHKYFYDLRAWIPRNIIIVNKAAFDALDPATQTALTRAAANAEMQGARTVANKTEFFLSEMRKNGMKVEREPFEMARIYRGVGYRLSSEWQSRAGPDGVELLKAIRN